MILVSEGKEMQAASVMHAELEEFYKECERRRDQQDKMGPAELEFMTEPELEALMKACGNAVKDIGHCYGIERLEFCLLVFNDPKVVQYAASCTRKSMIEAMKEVAARLEAKEDML